MYSILRSKQLVALESTRYLAISLFLKQRAACRVQGMPDSDDYFHADPKQLCIPDIPDDLNTESDSIDLDDVPCRVEDSVPMPSTPASSSAAHAVSSSASTSAPSSAPAAGGREPGARRPPSAGSPISRSACALINAP